MIEQEPICPACKNERVIPIYNVYVLGEDGLPTAEPQPCDRCTVAVSSSIN